MKIDYKQSNDIPKDQLLNLYNDVGWTAYTKEPDKLCAAVQASLKVFTAWKEDELLGLIRVVGDGLTIVYIQDILVKTEYHRQGIGSTLMSQILEDYADVRQLVLMTDDVEKNRTFYSKVGFQACDNGKLIAFARMKQ